MIAALISITSLAAAIQWVYYCRSAVTSTQNVQPSPHVLRALGMANGKPNGGDFERFLELARLCPERGNDAAQMRGVAIYYQLLHLLARLLGEPLPAVSCWARREQKACSHFAAIVLDRRISSSRDLFSQHRFDRP